MSKRPCWCGNTELQNFSAEYGRCPACGTLVSNVGLSEDELKVRDDDNDFYGKQYWLSHQTKDLGFPSIQQRARDDLTDRNLHWLRALIKYRRPPAKVLELGCSHGSFVSLLRQAGYDAAGVEMSPWVVEYGKETFGVPISVGPVESLNIAPGSLDVIALMDVLEHLPDPEATMKHCLGLLKPNGLLLIQTPQFKDEMSYKELKDTDAPFLEQFKSDEHLYLFTDRSVARLFSKLGADHIEFMTAIFHQYDMFFAVSRKPLGASTKGEQEIAMMSTPSGRLVQAILDLDDRVKERDVDRANRLDQIHVLTRMVHELQAAQVDKTDR